jgi:hypothetical protein
MILPSTIAPSSVVAGRDFIRIELFLSKTNELEVIIDLLFKWNRLLNPEHETVIGL